MGLQQYNSEFFLICGFKSAYVIDITVFYLFLVAPRGKKRGYWEEIIKSLL